MRLAADIAEFAMRVSSRDDLAYAYWVLLQSSSGLNDWPARLRKEFEAVQETFFRYGLPPQTAKFMTVAEAEEASEQIRAFVAGAEWAAARQYRPAETKAAPAPELPGFAVV